MPTHRPPSGFGQALKGGFMIAAILVPIIFTIMILAGYRGFYDFGPGENAQGPGPEIVCLSDDRCILKVRGKWYVVSDVLDEDDVPIKFRLAPKTVIIADPAEAETKDSPNE